MIFVRNISQITYLHFTHLSHCDLAANDYIENKVVPDLP